MLKKFPLALVTVFAVLAFFAGTTIVSVLNGGTGLSNPSAHTVLVGEGSSPMAVVGPGSSGQCLEGNGGSTDPSFQTCPISGGTSGGGFAWGGSGADGSITADASTTYGCLGAPGTFFSTSSAYEMVRDCNATTFKVNSGVTVFSNGFRLFASTSAEFAGALRDDGLGGGAASGAVNGPAGAGEQSSATTFATSCIWRTSGNCQNGNGAGVGGGGSSSNGSAGGAGTAGTDDAIEICSANGVAGQAGGGGGAGSGHTGGSGGAAGTTQSCASSPVAYTGYSLPVALTWLTQDYNNGAGVVMIGYEPTNAGSGGGGGGGGDGTNAGGNGGGAGGSGGNGGMMVVSSPTITVDSGGTISASGGNGGNGANGVTAGAGNAGGGGGGSGGTAGNGGLIVLVYHSYTNSGTVQAAAGSGGSPGSGGALHGTGSNGSNGTTGNNGLAGLILQIPQ